MKSAVLLLGFLLVVLPGHSQLRDGGIDPANLGKGDWIYSIADATNKLGGHVSSVTNETSLMLFYKNQGIRYLIVKAGTGATKFNACYGFPQFSTYLVNVAHANGLLIFGYNRSYATNTSGEIAIANFVFNQGADGFVWDAEGEWESSVIGSSGPSLAWAQCGSVRTNWPNKFLAHAPFPIISYHNSFPYKEFGYWCDAVMPQIYHSGWSGVRGTASGGINWSDVNWALWQKTLTTSNSVVNGVRIWWTNSIKPLIPDENVYGPVGSSPCEGTTGPLPDKDVMEFIDYLAADPHAVTPGGYKGVNFWRTDLHGPAQWANIKAGTGGNFSSQVNNLVIDDAKVQTSGSWTMVRTCYNGVAYTNISGTDTNAFGTNYLTRNKGTGAGYAQFTPNIVVAGDYNVFQWHPFLTNASAAVPFVITYNGGTTTVYANQQTNAGNWSLLGKFNFLAGTSGNVRVTDAISEPTGVAIVDGLKLVFVPPPAPLITNQPQSQATVLGGSASFSVGAMSSAPLSYQWQINNTDLPGQTSATMNLTDVQPADLANYQVWVSNAGGSVLSATAALRQAASPTLVSPSATPPNFALIVPTEIGPSYTLEYKLRLDDPEWLAVTNVPGSGNPLQLVDPVATNPARFYRVHVQ